MQPFMLRALLISSLLCAVPAVAGEVYNNGPINGTTDAWTINFGFVVTDTFTVSTANVTLGSLAFGAWLFQGDVLQSVEVSVTSEAFGGRRISMGSSMSPSPVARRISTGSTFAPKPASSTDLTSPPAPTGSNYRTRSSIAEIRSTGTKILGWDARRRVVLL